jgi:aspartate aminotransferase-like enzyme
MHKKLFIPGPTEVLPEVLQAQTKPMFGHRMKEASELGTSVINKLKKVLETDQQVIIWTASGSLIMEASVRNSVKKGVLSTICGAFSERWHKMAKANGLPAGKIEVEWGKAIKPEMVDAELATGSYDVLCLTHNETSTGVMNPVSEIADMVHENRGFYTDFLQMKKYIDERGGQTPSTPALSLYNALDFQLDRMLAEGMDARYKRHSEMAERTRAWIREHFELFPEPGYESQTVSVGKNTKGVSIADLNKKLGERGLAIANGYGKLKEQTFRIAHMGDLQVKDIDEVLAAIDEILGH